MDHARKQLNGFLQERIPSFSCAKIESIVRSGLWRVRGAKAADRHGGLVAAILRKAVMQFNEDQLKHAVREFAFDVQHFRCYVKMHRSGMLNGHPSVAQAVRYSLLLHLRVVLDFFYGPTREDGVGVGHFRKTFPAFGAKFRKIKVPKPADAERIRMNLHKRLAHLTSTRWEVRAPAMNYYDSYFDDTDALIIAFKDALPSDVQQVFLKGLRDWDSKHPAAI